MDKDTRKRAGNRLQFIDIVCIVQTSGIRFNINGMALLLAANDFRDRVDKKPSNYIDDDQMELANR